MARATKSRETTKEEIIIFLGRLLSLKNYLPPEDAATTTRMVNILLKLDLPEMKSCRKCGETHPATSEFFDIDDRNRGGLVHQCRKCRSRYNKKRRQNHRIATSYSGEDKDAINELRAQHNLTPLPEGIHTRD